MTTVIRDGKGRFIGVSAPIPGLARDGMQRPLLTEEEAANEEYLYRYELELQRLMTSRPRYR